MTSVAPALVVCALALELAVALTAMAAARRWPPTSPDTSDQRQPGQALRAADSALFLAAVRGSEEEYARE
ncbi:hypothetical protein [Streptomyces niger]|uniref:hypothetical protein n=1 Tax=Streptomyces niger TaxID=66373 RepID=UPI00069ADFA6|nr:hypothetical protein [Streptomyces niger]